MNKLIFLLLFAAAAVAQDIPKLINYTGVLADANGKPLSGQKIIRVMLLDKQRKQIDTWEQTDTVNLSGGMFSIILGKNRDLPILDERHNIGIEVQGDNSIIAIPLYSSPFALNIPNASVTNAKIKDGEIEPQKLAAPKSTSGKSQMLVYDVQGAGEWKTAPAFDSTVKTLNGLSNNIRILDDNDNDIVLATNATGDPQTLRIEFRGIKSVEGNDGIDVSTSTNSNKSKKVTIGFKDIALSKLNTQGVPNGSILQYDETKQSWIPADTKDLMPVGSVIAFAGNFDKIPSKWLVCDGQVMRREGYEELWDVIGTAHGKPQGGDFALPDLRGMFIRGVDNTTTPSVKLPQGKQSTGRDPDSDSTKRIANTTGGNTGNKVGSVQSDAFQGHQHKVIQNALAGTGWADLGGGATTETGKRDMFDFEAGETREYIKDYNNPHFEVPRISSETRPKNVGLIYIIKAKP